MDFALLKQASNSTDRAGNWRSQNTSLFVDRPLLRSDIPAIGQVYDSKLLNEANFCRIARGHSAACNGFVNAFNVAPRPKDSGRTTESVHHHLKRGLDRPGPDGACCGHVLTHAEHPKEIFAFLTWNQ